MTLTIELPFPDSHLLPNKARTLPWQVRAGYAQPARMTSKVETLNAINGREIRFPTVLVPLHVTFHEPNARARDLDGLLSALKPSLDGIADALEIDDRHFEPITLQRGMKCKGGKVVIVIGRDLAQGG